MHVNQRSPRQKVRAVRFVPREKLGQNALLTRILAHMRTWRHPNTVKTLTTPKKVRVKSHNGKAEGLGKSRLGQN